MAVSALTRAGPESCEPASMMGRARCRDDDDLESGRHNGANGCRTFHKAKPLT